MALTLKAEEVIPTILEVYHQNKKCFPELSEEFRYIMVKKKLLKDYKLVVFDENLDEILEDQENVKPIALKKPAFNKNTRKSLNSFTFKDIAQIEIKTESARKAIPKPIFQREDIPLLRLFEDKSRKAQLKQGEKLSKIPRWSPKKTTPSIKVSPKITPKVFTFGSQRVSSSPVGEPSSKRFRYNKPEFGQSITSKKSGQRTTKIFSLRRNKKSSEIDVGSILDLIKLDDITCDLLNFKLV